MINPTGKKTLPLTEEEDVVVKKLLEVFENWPDSLWLYEYGGLLVVLQKDANNERQYSNRYRSVVDLDYVITQIDTKNSLL